MTNGFDRPDSQDLFNSIKSMFENTVLNGGTVLPESNEWYAVALQHGVAESFYAIADEGRKQLDPATACFDNLVELASRDGVFPRAAVQAQGYVKLLGTAGDPIDAPLQMVIDGMDFATSNQEGQPTLFDLDGEATIRVAAVIGGAQGNVATGTPVTVTNAPASLIAATVCGTFCNGADVECESEFRQRYIDRLSYQPRATATWVEEKLSEWPCVTRVGNRGVLCCADGDCASTLGSCGSSDCQSCGGSLDFYVLMDSAFPNVSPPRSVLDEIECWMFGTPQGYGLGQAEIGVCGRIVSFDTVAVNINVTLTNCPTAINADSIRDAFAEYVGTLLPGQLFDTELLLSTAVRLLGTDAAETRIEVTPVADQTFYGGPYGLNTDAKTVYYTNCFLEPDCDVLITLGNVVLNVGDDTF